MAGEVLQRGEHAVVAQPLHIGLDEPRHRARVLAERAGIDDRVQGVVVEVGVGSEIDVDADGAALDRRGGRDGFRVPRVAARAHGHDLRERGGADDAHPGAPLQVRRDE